MVSLRLNNRSKDKRFSPWGPTFVEIWRWTQWRRKPWVGTVARTLHPLGPRKCINLDFRWLSRKDIGENAGVICEHNQGLRTITVDLLTPVLFVVISWFFVSLKTLLNLLQYCCCFMLWFSWSCSMWDLSSPTQDWTHNPCIGRWGPSHWTPEKIQYYL